MGKPNTRNNSCSSQDEQNMTVDEKLSLLLKEVREIKGKNSECLSEITNVKEDIARFKEDMSKAQDMCFEKIKDCEASVACNTAKLSQCETITDNLRSENDTLKKTVADLKKRAAAGEQYSRSNCLEISGVPESRNENICEIVKQVAYTLNFKLEDFMIDAAHRLSKNPNKPESPRGIIIKFCRRIDMEEFRRRAKVKRSINAAELGYRSENKIYVNLSMTKETRHLWAQVRKFKDDNGYKYAWITSSGKVFLRKKEGRAAVFISVAEDLDGLK